MVLNDVEKQLVLEKFEGTVPELIKQAGHSELWGYDLTSLLQDESSKQVKSQFLQKFLRANNHKLEESKQQLLKTLKWRKQFCPLSAAFKEEHKQLLNDTAFVTVNDGHVTTWNLYGAVKDRHELFGDLEAFLRWRIGLMEQGIALLDFNKPDTSFMTQVHDYMGVSMWNMDAETKAATKKTIEVFQNYYPEFLDRKYFINVPKLMSWMFALVKPLVSKETSDKFVVMDNGANLGSKMGEWVPKDGYGGKGGSLKEQAVSGVNPRDEQLVETVTEAWKSSKKTAEKEKAKPETGSKDQEQPKEDSKEDTSTQAEEKAETDAKPENETNATEKAADQTEQSEDAATTKE